MKKSEFLAKLRKQISMLEDKEIEDIVSEYETYIDEKVSSNMSEEEAVKELGDLDEIVSDLLAAYKVKQNKEDDSGVNRFFNRLANVLDKFMDELSDKSAKDILRILIEIIIILIFIGIFKIPFNLIGSLGRNIFDDLGTVGLIFGDVWEFLVDLSYVVVAILFLVKIVEKRYFRGISERIIDEFETQDVKKKKPKEKVRTESKKKENNLGDDITSVGILVLKIIVNLFLIVDVFYLLAITIIFALMIYLICNGVTYFGFLILIFALFLVSIWILDLGIKFVCNKHISPYSILSKIISFVIIMGLGLAFSAIDLSNTQIIYDQHYVKTKSVQSTLMFEDNMLIYNYDKIVIDNTLDNMIKIEYIYPDFNNNINIEIDVNKYNNSYYLDTNIVRARWSIEVLKQMIDTLKEKKIYVTDYKIEKVIYISEDNYNKIKINASLVDNIYISKNLKVLEIQKSENQNYVYLTLEDFKEDTVEVLKVNGDMFKNIEIDENYDFKFKCFQNDDVEDLEDIFDECELVEISF